MILAYRVLTTILYPFLIILVYLRKFLKKEDPKRFREKIFTSHFGKAESSNFRLVWFHAASIGEFKSIIPIIYQLNHIHKNFRFLVTTSTFSSGKIADLELKKFNNVFHRYCPFDVPFLIDSFLNTWKPNKIFLVDSEIWPNLILKAKKYGIPIALINARLTSKSFKRWMIFPNMAKKIFGIFDLFICSNIDTKKKFEILNLKNIYYKGNLKLIDHIDEEKIRNPNEATLTKRRFWFAASTHKEEDILCIKTHLRLKEKFKDILTIIAPRHIDRANQIKKLSEKFYLKTQILNKDEKILNNKEVLIINHFGVLQNYFKYAKSVFIGKSTIERLKEDGGQNPIEAAKLNCKIYHGPYVYNFNEIYDVFNSKNISKQVNDHEELSENLAKDLENPYKKNSSTPESIKNLGQETLNDTIRLLGDFLNDDDKAEILG